jgi:hypothetical protein
VVEWTQSDPGAGSTAAMGNSMSNLKSAQTRLGSAHDAALKAIDSVTPDVWSGAGVASWLANTSTSVEGFFDITGVYAMAHSAIADYLTKVQGIQRQVAHYTGELHDATRIRASIPATGYDWQPVPTDEDLKHKALATSKESDAHHGLQMLANQRRDADEALAAVLRQSLPSSWKKEHKAFVAAGITKANQVNAADIAAAMTKLTQYSAAHAGLSDPASLLELLNTYSGDPTVLNAFYQKMGGANTVDLITMLGKSVHPGGADNAQALAIAEQVRSGLSLVSRDWTTSVGAQFADAMFNGVDPEAGTPNSNTAEEAEYIRGRAESIGFLFNGLPDAPMGQTLTVEMAGKVVAWEQLTHSEFVSTLPLDYPGSGASGGLEVSAGRLSQLEQLQSQHLNLADSYYGGAGTATSANDATGRILQTLGTYPPAAAAFLEGQGKKGIEYIFQTRDWSGVDGFAGPSALLLGAEKAPGGPGGIASNSVGAQKLSTVESEALYDLAHNATFKPESLSADASISLGTAIGLNIDSFVANRSGDASGANMFDDGSGHITFRTLGGSTETSAPLISLDTMSTLLGQVGATNEGALVLGLAIRANENNYLSIGERNNGALLNGALQRTNTLSGLMNGSAGGARDAVGLRADQANDQKISDAVSAVAFLVSFIPIPGGDIVGVLADASESAGADSIASAIGSSQHKLAAVEALTGHVAHKDEAVQYAANVDALRKAHGVDPMTDPSLVTQLNSFQQLYGMAYKAGYSGGTGGLHD